MEDSVNWVIATYSATNTCMALEMQLQSLYVYFSRNTDRHKVTQVTVMTPPVRARDQKRDCGPSYFQKQKWQRLLKHVGVRLKSVLYKGTNNYASYDQWIQGYLRYPNFKWYVTIEDDYLIHPSAPSNLIDQWIQLHENAAITGKGAYVCTYAAATDGLSYHAAISNGIIGRDAFRAIPNILETYYQTVSDTYKQDAQIAFSNMFMKFNIPLKSMHGVFAAIFWSSTRKWIENFSPSVINKYGIVPLQILTTQCGDIKAKTHL